MNKICKMTTLNLLVLACGLCAGAQYSIDWNTIDGGGGISTGGVFSLSGTISQPDADYLIPGGKYIVAGGFWSMFAQPDLPVIGPVVATQFPVEVGTLIAACAPFEDDFGPQVAMWDWGDGYTSIGVIDQDPLVVSGTHTFSNAGVYTVTVYITNRAGLTGVRSFKYVVVFDPGAGFVTGGGWIWSPAGALHPDLVEYADVTGKASFGFVAKYQKGAKTPIGNAQFQFKAGDLNFHSTSYQWLVVTRSRAQFKGVGLINGAEGYGFMLTGIDGNMLGGAQSDRFRIQIWDLETEMMIYDNQPNTDMDADLDSDGTLVQGGSVVVHHK